MRKLVFALITIPLLLTGCGDDGEGSSAATATLVLNTGLAPTEVSVRALRLADVSELRVSATDAADPDSLLFGPVTLRKAPAVTVREVPTVPIRVRVEFLDADGVRIAAFSLVLVLRPGETRTVDLLDFEPEPREIVVFGDNLSDSGTYNPTTADNDPANDAAVGFRFTTRPGGTWADHLAADFGLPLTANQRVDFGVVGEGGRVLQLGGLNFAEGGARILLDGENGGVVNEVDPVVGTVPVQMATRRAIASQITDYLGENGSAFDGEQLVLIEGGANDFIDFLAEVATDPTRAARAPTVISNSATAMIEQILRMRTAGAARIVYANLPDLGGTPRYRGTPLAGLATTLTTNYNGAVASALRGSEVSVFDTYTLFAEMIREPAGFGLGNVTSPACNSFCVPGDPSTLSALFCSPDTLVEVGADESYLFADGVNPTARAHRIWATRVFRQLASGS